MILVENTLKRKHSLVKGSVVVGFGIYFKLELYLKKSTSLIDMRKGKVKVDINIFALSK